MIYKEFGKTGVKVSALGFGAMRFPMKKIDGKEYVDQDLAVPLLQRAFELGVNYVDSAPYYCASQSEETVGKALKGWRDKVYVSTKFPISRGRGKPPHDFEEEFYRSLRKLDVEYIDFYHFWNMNYRQFQKYVIPKGGMLEKAMKLKEQGLIRHISFSCHDTPHHMMKMIDTGAFETMLCQYNFLDRTNEKAIAHAKEKGMGVVIMGPVGGGRLGAPSEMIQQMLPGKVQSTAEMALRFVLSNPNVTVALSGMENIQMLEENAKVASNGEPLSEEELRTLDAMIEEKKKLSDLYCTECKYCLPCPKKVAIPFIFEQRNYQAVYGLDQYARQQYAQLKKADNGIGTDASECVGCRLCVEKCPQKIDIPAKLEECHAALKG